MPALAVEVRKDRGGYAAVLATAGLPVAALVVLCGLLLAVLVRHGQPLTFDLAVRHALAVDQHGASRRLASILTQLGGGPVLYRLLGLLSALRLRERAGNSLGWVLLPVVALAGGQVLEGVLFVTIPRASPSTGAALPATGYSFSSGHVAAATLAFGFLIHSLRVRRASQPRVAVPASATCLLAVAAGLAVGTTRIALGLHWASDVLAAVAFGLLFLVAAVAADAVLAAPDTNGDRAVPVAGRLPASPWLWLVPAAAVLLSVVPLLLTPGPDRLKDLLVYQGAGRAAGSGTDVYGFRTVFRMPFTYPPFAALLSEPLSRIPVGLGQALWTTATLAGLVALCRVTLTPITSRLGLPLTLAALVSSPVRSHLRFGQVGVFLVLMVASDLLQPAPRSRIRGWGLGVAIAIKLTPAVFLPWLVVTRSWQRLRGTLTWLIGASVLGLLLLRGSASNYIWHASSDTTRFGANDIPGNQSVRGMLLRSDLPDRLVQPSWLAISLLLLAIGTYGARRLERENQRLAAVGVLASLSVAVSPISWVHHLIWLVLPIAALAAAHRWRLAVAWYVVLLPGLPALGAAAARTGRGPEALWSLVTDLQGLTAVAAVVALPLLCLRRPVPAPSAGRPAARTSVRR